MKLSIHHANLLPMSAFNFESGSGKQSDDFLFSKKNNNNDNKNTLRFDQILDHTK